MKAPSLSGAMRFTLVRINAKKTVSYLLLHTHIGMRMAYDNQTIAAEIYRVILPTQNDYINIASLFLRRYHDIQIVTLIFIVEILIGTEQSD